LENRIAALRTIILAKPDRLSDIISKTLLDIEIPVEDRSEMIDALGASRNEDVAQWLASHYKDLDPNFQPKIVELLSQRPTWAASLLEHVSSGDIPTERFNLNQLRRLSSFKDEALQQQITKLFGSVRQNNSKERAGVVNRMRDMLGGMKGDPFAGRVVFKRVCSQCHVLHGDGFNVGPDITRNGRNNWYQLIQNVFDPSAVIGPGFQAVIILTDDGRVLTGVPTEETEQAITLKMQGGKIETISKDGIEEIKRSDVSLMPEQVENQMSSQEIADLFAYLSLDKPPEDSTAVQLSGAPPHQIREKAQP
jgi:putative heme-binding domain-containing protein